MKLKYIIVLFAGLYILTGCSHDVSGRYQGTKLQGSYLDLNKDGTFQVAENDKISSGKYKFEDDQIIMIFDNGMTGKYPLQENKIVAGTKETYVKK
jgi:hypothetical protein